MAEDRDQDLIVPLGDVRSGWSGAVSQAIADSQQSSPHASRFPDPVQAEPRHHIPDGGHLYSDITPGSTRPAGATINPASALTNTAATNQR
jgi:hypothetical protein